MGGVATCVSVDIASALLLTVARRVGVHEAEQGGVGHTRHQLVSYGGYLSICIVLGKGVADALQLVRRAAHIKHVRSLVLPMRVIVHRLELAFQLLAAQKALRCACLCLLCVAALVGVIR